MINPAVSIIVPVYNAEEFLSACLDSIQSQSFPDFELILVNDGSTDDSLDICKSRQLLDNRIIVIDKPNGGVSSARNVALNVAKCRYITFVDSDDTLKPDFIESLMSLSTCDAEWVLSGMNGSLYKSNKISKIEKLDNHYLNIQTGFDLFELMTLSLITSPCAKLYDSRIIKKYNIRFNENLSYGEDRDFNLRYASRVKICISTSYCGYMYRMGVQGSLSTNDDIPNLLNIDLQYWKDLKDLFAKNISDKDIYGKYLANRLINFINDRLIQYNIVVKPTFGGLRKRIKHIVDTEEYRWLIANYKSIEANILTKLVYRIASPVLLTAYVKHVSK